MDSKLDKFVEKLLISFLIDLNIVFYVNKIHIRSEPLIYQH
jgi:hypothetical protein